MRDGDSMELFYRRPAAGWEEALPLGNGRLGAMLSSDPYLETIWLNEDSFWSGRPAQDRDDRAYKNSHSRQAMARRQKLWARLKQDRQRADRKIENDLARDFLGDYSEACLPLGKLLIRQDAAAGSSVALYERRLDLEKAVLETSFTMTGGQGMTAARQPLREFRREAFVSHPDQALIMRWQARDAAPLSLHVAFDTPFGGQIFEQHFSENGATLLFGGQAPDHLPPTILEQLSERTIAQLPHKGGMRFAAGLEIRLQGEHARIAGGRSGVRLEGAEEVIFMLTILTSWRYPELEPVLRNRMGRLRGKTYSQLKARHEEDYTSLSGTFSFKLNRSNEADRSRLREHVRSDSAEQLKRFQSTPTNKDAALYETLLQYARYLSLAASREDSLPMHRRGLWNPDIQAPEHCNFDLELGTALNYASLGQLGLWQLTDPLLNLLEEFASVSRETAEDFFGTGGLVCHSNSDLWGFSEPEGRNQSDQVQLGLWPLGAVNLCQSYARQLLYVPEAARSERTLRLLGILQDSVRFCLNLLAKSKAGSYVFGPLSSPNRRFLDEEGNERFLTAWTAQGQLLVAEHFETFLAIAEGLMKRAEFPEILDADLYEEVKQVLPLLQPPLLITEAKGARRGSLAEWDEAWKAATDRKSPAPLLQGLFPGNSLQASPAMAEAARRTVLAGAEKGTGPALAWSACLWAVLKDGDRALRLLQSAMRPLSGAKGSGLLPNYLAAGPGLGIEGNMTIASALMLLFLQEDKTSIYILPALPLDFTDGEIRGLRTQKGLLVDICFAERALTEVVLVNPGTTSVRTELLYRKKSCLVELEPGGERTLRRGDFR